MQRDQIGVEVTLHHEPTHPGLNPDRAWTGLLGIGAAGSLALLLLGSYVHNLYVSGWPLVGDTMFPDLSNRFVAVHYLHRALAAVGFVYLVYLAIDATRRERPEMERLLINAAAAAYLLNIVLGAAHVFTEVGSSALVAGHLVVASLVWALLVGVTMIARSGPPTIAAADGESELVRAPPA